MEEIKQVDEMIGAFGEQLMQLPQGGQELAKRLEAVRAEYRDIMTQAMSMMEQGGGGQKSSPQPVADRSQGTPVGPQGAY